MLPVPDPLKAVLLICRFRRVYLLFALVRVGTSGPTTVNSTKTAGFTILLRQLLII